MYDFSSVWAEISIDNIKNNLKIVRNNLKKSTKIMAVIKSNAYGHGLSKVAKILDDEGIDYFAVNSVSEGAKLIDEGIKVPILILKNIATDMIKDLLERNLIPTVCSTDIAEEINSYGKIKNKRFKIHIKIDSGSFGDGIPYNEFDKFFKKLKKMNYIEIDGIYCHLASSYSIKNDRVYWELKNFRVVLDYLLEKDVCVKFIHTANSPLIFNHPEAHFNMVRVGTALYGIPFINDSIDNRLKPAMTIKSKIMNIKKFKEGCIAGYGGYKKSSEPITIAYISTGYYEIPFLLYVNDLKVIVKGNYISLYGKPAMNYSCLDITKFNNIKIGDEVVILGEQQDKNITYLDITKSIGIDKVNSESICFLGNSVPYIYKEQNKFVK